MFIILSTISTHVVSAQTDTIVLNTEIFQRWKESKWANLDRSEFIYNNNGSLNLCYFDDWNGNAWERIRSKRYYYDDKRNLLKIIPYIMKGDEWIINEIDMISIKYFYYYDSLNNMIEYRYVRFKDDKWTNIHRDLYKYDINNNQVEEIHQIWNDEQWKNVFKFKYFYNVKNNVVLYERYRWYDSLEWVLGVKHEYNYNNKNLLTQETTFVLQNENWLYDEKILSYWNESNQLDSLVYYDYINEKFVEESKIVNKYDNNGNRVQDIYQEWIHSSWQNKYDYLYEYDTNDMLIEEINRHENSSNGELENYSRNLYTYKTILTSVNESKEIGGKAYCSPNPVISNTKLNFETTRPDNIKIDIYDCLGNEIMIIHNGQMPEGRHEIVFDASALPGGIYYFRIIGGGACETVKMMLCR